MPPKKKSKTVKPLKRLSNPADDVLKKNIYLSKYAKFDDNLDLVEDIRYESVSPSFTGATLNDSDEFRFQIAPSTDYFTSFFTDFQLVVDAKIIVRIKQTTAGEGLNNEQDESLFPQRHKLCLPLNGLNSLFEDCSVSFNHHTRLDSDRSFFLDFDGWGLLSSLEQNFNPALSNIRHKEKKGYLRLMSTDYLTSSNIIDAQHKVFFPGKQDDNPQNNVNASTRFYMSLPCFPFRTLSPRSMTLFQTGKVSSSSSVSGDSSGGGFDFDYASCLLPAHTQVSVVLKRRKVTDGNMLDFMLPVQLSATRGSDIGSLTQAERDAALTFVGRIREVANDDPVNVYYKILSVKINIVDISLQVCRLRYKNISPEKPLSNIYNSYRSVFTPIQNVSLHTYDLAWETTAKPVAVFISFVKQTDVQHSDTNRLFHTPGVYYRPASLKSMTCLLGNTESRTVYHNFQLNNLNTNGMDMSHLMYQRYLETQFFVPPGDTSSFFSHYVDNKLPEAPSAATNKGWFNVFPLSLQSDKLQRSAVTTSSLGIITQSPLRLELEFQPVPTIQWFLVFTFLYMNKINFTGSTSKQDVTFDFV